jgi:hypothetical protein
MPNAKLIVTPFDGEPREVELAEGITTFGRAGDNTVAFAGDSNVSRYHAEIERRGNNFYVVDIGSSNGTSVNDEPLTAERRLEDGDTIVFGGGGRAEFHAEKQAKPKSEKAAAGGGSAGQMPALPTANAANPAGPEVEGASKMPIVIAVAAVLVGVAVVSIVAVILLLPTAGGTSNAAGGCIGTVSILSPENGVTISEETDIKVDVKDAKCVERVSYMLDGEEVAATESAPYSVTLEPESLGQFADGNSHILTVAVINLEGERQIQSDEITLAFADEEKDEPKSTGDSGGATTENPPRNDAPSDKQVSLNETKQMCERLIKQFSGNSAYKLDSQFLQQVQKRTADYKSEGFYNRAAGFNDQIKVAFVGEQGLDAPLGYALAMSRSKFEVKNADAKTKTEEGLWRMTNELVAGNGYNGQCGAETLSDAAQNCAARAAAIYTKALVVNLFQGDFIYGVSCFGMSPAEAGQFQITLPAERSDFWNVIKSPKQRETLVNFFAASIVAENPQKFGLKRDKPISGLYRNLIGKPQ